MPTHHLLIRGKVQGVFYRANAKEMADKLGITGWIQNTPGADVEAVISGSEQQLEAFTAWCRQGSRRAVVSEVIATPREEVVFKDFSINRDSW